MKTEYMSLDDIVSSTVTVVGLGISNIPLIEFLLKSGAKNISARDKQQKENLPKEIISLEKEGVTLICGESYLENIDERVIFRSPGIRPDTKEFEAAKKNGSFVTSEMELFLSLCPATVLAVTGSDGKTTTTTLSYKIMEKMAERKKTFSVFVGGNIGNPLLPLVDRMKKEDFAILELSSFQLQDIRFAPSRAVITNITPNHLNWHTDYFEYIEAKKQILGKDTVAVLNAQNEETAKIAEERSEKIVFSAKMSEDEIRAIFPNSKRVYEKGGYILYYDGATEFPVMKTEDIKLPGLHNVENYMAAFALTLPYADIDTVKELAREFSGVEHRLEFVRMHRGVKYYNSSIDSSPVRTAAALSALKEKPIVICGGASKGITFELLADALCERAKAVILTGQTADEIEKTLNNCEKLAKSELKIIKQQGFENAVLRAREEAKEGDTVLLSPACTSFDAFKNFNERGRAFKSIVNSFED